MPTLCGQPCLACRRVAKLLSLTAGKLAERERLWGPAIADAMRELGVPAVWGLAIARHESSFRPEACNLTNGDGARGGAWGLFQMTFKTAQGLGYLGEPSGLLVPPVNIDLAAMLLARLTIPYKTLRDVAAAYNSGKPFASAPESTRLKYVPRIIALTEQYAARSDLLSMRA